jgi:site-specific DNA-methyltransferase (adenine-specific)
MTNEPILNQILNEDCLVGISKIADESIDLICTDPPYSLGKDYGNDSDKKSPQEYLNWTYRWIDLCLPKLKKNGSFYIFLSWQFSPEIFVYLKQKMIMINEIIWDRRVPSMGGSTRKYSSVHDNIGFFVKDKNYHFDIDEIRIPYDAATKKARSRKIFEGKKWLEMGYNPKDVWCESRLHAQDLERENHPTQKPLKIIERIVRASCPKSGIVLDPFMGSGTSAVAALKNNRNFIGFEINKDYHQRGVERIKNLKSQTNQKNSNDFLLEESSKNLERKNTQLNLIF